MASFVKREENVLETPWRSYRKILLKFLEYLKMNEREEDFKYLTYGYIPAKNMDCSIVDWLLRLEQSDKIRMDDFKMLYDFLINFDDPDSSQILSVITKFQRRQNILQMISNSGGKSNQFYTSPQLLKYREGK